MKNMILQFRYSVFSKKPVMMLALMLVSAFMFVGYAQTGFLHLSTKHGKYGYTDDAGNTAIAFVFDYAEDFRNNKALVCKDGLYGFIDQTGKIVIPLKFTRASTSPDGFFAVEKGGKWKVYDYAGNEVMSTIYNDGDYNFFVGSLSEGMILMNKGGKYGYLDAAYKEVIPFVYDIGSPFVDGMAAVKKGEKWGFIDRKGVVVIPFNFEEANLFSDGLAKVVQKGKVIKDKRMKFIDRTGKVVFVVKLKYHQVGNFVDGTAIVSKSVTRSPQVNFWYAMTHSYLSSSYSHSYTSGGVKTTYTTNTYAVRPPINATYYEVKFEGAIDKTGRKIIPMKKNQWIVRHEGGILEVCQEVRGKYTTKSKFYDRKGKSIAAPAKKQPASQTQGYVSPSVSNITPVGRLTAYTEGSKYGFIDEQFRIIIPLQYDAVRDFSEGLALVEIKDKWGLIDKTGKAITPIEYGFIDSFSEGLAAVRRDTKWGFIDKMGKVIVPIEYDNLSPFNGNGVARVCKNKQWGFIDRTGKIIVPLQYVKIELLDNGFLATDTDGKTTRFDVSGKPMD